MKVLEPPKRSPSGMTKYGLNRHDFERLWHATNGRCPVCTKAFTHDRRRPAAIDHDHRTGRVRGLVCRQCNYLLGTLHSDTSLWIARAAAYLRSPTANVLRMVRVHRDAPPEE